MFNDFEIKLNKDDNWVLRYLHVYHGIFIAESENDYKKGKKISIPLDSEFNITKENTPNVGEYYVLSIKSKDQNVFIRADQKISLEYIIYNSQQKNERDMGRPMTFVPHLINVDSVLYHTRIRNFQFEGLINLVVIALIFSHLRLMYDNFMKTGLMLSKEGFLGIISHEGAIYGLIYLSFIVSAIIIAYLIEKLAGVIRKEKITYLLNFLNFSMLLSPPFLLKHFGFYDPIIGQGALLLVCIVFLKLYSFSHFWNDVRKFIYKKQKLKQDAKERRLSKLTPDQLLKILEDKAKEAEYDKIDEQNVKHESLVQKNDELKSSMYEEIESIITNYPNNVSFFSLVEFLFMPALCYQYKFPRTKRIRATYLLEYGFKIIICLFLQ